MNVGVTVWSRMLMPKADDVAKLMNHNAQFVAILANTDRLWTVASFADERTTAKGDRLKKFNWKRLNGLDCDRTNEHTHTVVQ